MPTPLDTALNEHFPGKVVRKDLTARVKGNAVVPTYVLEYLLGQYCASGDEHVIAEGVETVKKILGKHYVHREEATLIQSTIRDKGSFRVIDRLSVALDDRRDVHVAAFTNLDLKHVPIADQYVKQNPKLLTGGVWCLVDVDYVPAETREEEPWSISGVKPIQLAHFDVSGYRAARQQFSTAEWIDALLQSIGFDPEHFSERQKLIQLSRLTPFAERNYNLIELGPKGTGKSHVFSELSPHGMLISGGEVTLAKLFVNNASGNIGLVGYWDSVAFDEFAGKEKRVQQSLVDVMKNYMANKTFSRGRDTYGAEASMVFVGNTKHSVAYMMRHANLFDQLPRAYYDTAFLDRLHYYLPGWEVSIIRGEMFTAGFGFIVDYLAEALRELRGEDYGDRLGKWFALDASIATRDKTAVTKTFSGLMKLLHPSGECTKEEARMLLEWALEGRRRVKLQLMKMDETFREREIRFAYRDLVSGEVTDVRTLEEDDLGVDELAQQLARGQSQEVQRADSYSSRDRIGVSNTLGPGSSTGLATADRDTSAAVAKTASASETPAAHAVAIPAHQSFRDGQRGVSYRRLFAERLRSAREIHVQDPYLRLYHQVRNLAEFCRLVYDLTPADEETVVKVWTKADEARPHETEKLLTQLETQLSGTRVNLDYQLLPPDDPTHDRYIETDTGWKCILGRGLDVFHRFDAKETFSVAADIQEERAVKAFEITWVRIENS